MPSKKRTPETVSADRAERSRVDALLDEALDESFPASDPVAISCERCAPGERRAAPSDAKTPRRSKT